MDSGEILEPRAGIEILYMCSNTGLSEWTEPRNRTRLFYSDQIMIFLPEKAVDDSVLRMAGPSCTSEVPSARPARTALPLSQPPPLDPAVSPFIRKARIPRFSHEKTRQRIAERRYSVRCCRITRCAFPLRGWFRSPLSRATSPPTLQRPRQVSLRPLTSLQL